MVIRSSGKPHSQTVFLPLRVIDKEVSRDPLGRALYARLEIQLGPLFRSLSPYPIWLPAARFKG